MTFPGTEPTDVFPCGGCGQPIRANDGHGFEDCVTRRYQCASALAGMDPAKFAALLEACDRYTIGPAPDGCGFCREGNCSATAHVAITAALAELRGEEVHRA